MKELLMSPLTVYACLALTFVVAALYLGRQARIVQERVRKDTQYDD